VFFNAYENNEYFAYLAYFKRRSRVVLSAVVGVFVYKEKLSGRQYIGVAFGVLAIVLMSM
jgi:glucose uptake protein GlcU